MHENEEEFPIGTTPWKTEKEFDAYFERIASGTATPNEIDDFNVMVMKRFCLMVYDGRPVDRWIMNHLADTFVKVLAGGAWADEFHLPWMKPTRIRSDAKQRGLEIYCFVKNALGDGKENAKVTKCLDAAAAQFNCSYETARGQYYAWCKCLSKNE